MGQRYMPDPNNPGGPEIPCGGPGQLPCPPESGVPAPRPTGALEELKNMFEQHVLETDPEAQDG